MKSNCKHCGSLLTTEESIKRGMGETCYIDSLEKEVARLKKNVEMLTALNMTLIKQKQALHRATKPLHQNLYAGVSHA